MADPKLVAYLRKQVPQFGAEAVRENLLEEGLGEDEIDEALAAAAKPPRKKPAALYAIFGAVMFGAVAAYMALDKPPAPGDKTGAAASEASPPSPAPAAGAKGPFMGHYGYLFQVPAGYATQTSFKDLGNRTEVVYLFPEKTDPTNFGNEGLYGQLGIMRLEVSPLRIATGMITFDTLKAGVTQTLNSRGDTYEMKEMTAGGLPGFVVNISQPFPLAQAFIVGTKVMYVLTAGQDSDTFRNTLQSLTEVGPHDNPAPAP